MVTLGTSVFILLCAETENTGADFVTNRGCKAEGKVGLELHADDSMYTQIGSLKCDMIVAGNNTHDCTECVIIFCIHFNQNQPSDGTRLKVKR